MKNLKKINELVESLNSYKNELKKSRQIIYKEKIKLSDLSFRNYYLNEAEFLLLQNSIQKILIDRNIELEKELNNFKILENGL